MEINDSKMEQNIKNRIIEISQIKSLTYYDIEELFKKAITQEIKNKFNIYIGSNLKIDKEKSLNNNVNNNIDRLNEIFGNMLEFKKCKDFAYLNNDIYFKDFDGSEYRKEEKTILKDNKIIGFKTYNLYSGFCSIVDRIYNAFYLFVEDKDLNDYKEFNDYIKENDLKENLYQHSGELKIKDFTFKLFKNGRLDITFKTNNDAKKFYEEFKRLQDKKHKITGWNF